jgi:hypothetical protein
MWIIRRLGLEGSSCKTQIPCGNDNQNSKDEGLVGVAFLVFFPKGSLRLSVLIQGRFFFACWRCSSR